FLTPYKPRKKIRSEGFTGAAAIRMSTSPGPGRGMGFSARESRPPYSRSSNALMVVGIFSVFGDIVRSSYQSPDRFLYIPVHRACQSLIRSVFDNDKTSVILCLLT